MSQNEVKKPKKCRIEGLYVPKHSLEIGEVSHNKPLEVHIETNANNKGMISFGSHPYLPYK